MSSTKKKKKKISKCSVLAAKLVRPGMREKMTKRIKHYFLMKFLAQSVKIYSGKDCHAEGEPRNRWIRNNCSGDKGPSLLRLE